MDRCLARPYRGCRSSVAKPLLCRLLPLCRADIPRARGVDRLRLLEAALHPARAIRLQLIERMIDMANEINRELLMRAVLADRRHKPGPIAACLGQSSQVAR